MNSLMKFLNQTKIFYLKRDLDLMVDLENYILRTFNSLNIINSSIKGIEFPINIRIVHPSKPKNLSPNMIPAQFIVILGQENQKT